ncbi:PREDICTED: uncharacterized protein LOC105145695 [Acromyrmex echinatior]|uniref:uncharacterized protein LOC105145695 n=1 Tax=Acromyrmex echinatior TaxID=103372 RepID=UPI000580D3B7|nr:PREDICTED: uncharacterized protein LOC105145695 [Acromyrmex echinatior]
MEKGPRRRRSKTERETKKNTRERSLPLPHLEKYPNASSEYESPRRHDKRRPRYGLLSVAIPQFSLPFVPIRLYLLLVWGANFPLSRGRERARVLGRRVRRGLPILRTGGASPQVNTRIGGSRSRKPSKTSSIGASRGEQVEPINTYYWTEHSILTDIERCLDVRLAKMSLVHRYQQCVDLYCCYPSPSPMNVPQFQLGNSIDIVWKVSLQ